MPLPDLLEIIPLNSTVRADIVVPGSKSITNRALIAAALAEGETVLRGALWSEDTQVMVEALHALGFDVRVEDDPLEFCNRTITVQGMGGRIPNAGSAEQPLEIHVGNAGTAARFLAAMVSLGRGSHRLHGVPRMHQRPQAALFDALRELGYAIDSPNGMLPAVIHGAGPKPGAHCKVSIGASSQFASALLLSAKTGGWRIEVTGENADESPYVSMTSMLTDVFPSKGGSFQIEPDASSGSYFWGVQPTVTARDWPSASGWQIDARFPEVFGSVTRGEVSTVSRQTDLGDSIMTAIALAPFAPGPVTFTELGRLRVQECERVMALRTELGKCGALVVEEGDTLTVTPGPALHGAVIETYNDHRMAMCFAIVGLRVPGIRLLNPACVKKTFPNFFQKLAAAPPSGLGATILDAATGRRIIEPSQLFAD